MQNSSAFQYLAVDQIHESTTNPRQTFEPSKLEELAESIRQLGLIQPITVQTILEREALCNLLDLCLALSTEVLRPFLNQELGNEDITSKAASTVFSLPQRPWVQGLVLGFHFFLNEVDQGLICGLNVSHVSAPCIDSKAMLLRQEVFEESHVGCIEGYVNHALKPDVLVQPDGPTEAILQKPSAKDWTSRLNAYFVVDRELVF